MVGYTMRKSRTSWYLCDIFQAESIVKGRGWVLSMTPTGGHSIFKGRADAHACYALCPRGVEANLPTDVIFYTI